MNFRNVYYENLTPNKSQKEDSKKEQTQQTNILCEQGDMGLFCDPLSKEDQKKYNEQN